jgi:hypothetical protein
MSRTFKTVDYAQALDLTVRLGDCLPPGYCQFGTLAEQCAKMAS